MNSQNVDENISLDAQVNIENNLTNEEIFNEIPTVSSINNQDEAGIKTVLLHCCCAPCGNKPFDMLTEEGFKVIPFFYNPNIHPYQEYKKRKNTFYEYFSKISKPIIINDYSLEEWLSNVAQNPLARCPYCYRTRMEMAAKTAKERGYDAFTTSLLISPYQKHELIIKIAQEEAEKYGVKFLYRDFRPVFREGQDRARELGMYMQGYCGCIYSEKDRYCKKKKSQIHATDN